MLFIAFLHFLRTTAKLHETNHRYGMSKTIGALDIWTNRRRAKAEVTNEFCPKWQHVVVRRKCKNAMNSMHAQKFHQDPGNPAL